MTLFFISRCFVFTSLEVRTSAMARRGKKTKHGKGQSVDIRKERNGGAAFPLLASCVEGSEVESRVGEKLPSLTHMETFKRVIICSTASNCSANAHLTARLVLSPWNDATPHRGESCRGLFHVI